jgi:hypothetical protein
MTTGRQYARPRGFLATLLVVSCAAGAGCASATIEDAVPMSAQAAAQPQAFATPGDYPNLNVIPTPAAEQITPEERAAQTAALRSTRESLQARTGDGSATDDRAGLRRIGQSHAEEALEAIEGE